MYEISIYDLQFAQRRMLGGSSIGAPVHHLVPYGMPKLNPDFLNAAFFLYREEPDPKGGKNRITGPWGTGAFVGRPIPGLSGTGAFHVYGVSNRHVVHQAGASIIRVNT